MMMLKCALGSITFGIYNMYLTTNLINENNRNIQLRFDELFQKIERLEKNLNNSYMSPSK